MSDSSAGHAANPPSAPRFVFEPISESHATAAFRCGAAFLDRFLVQDALMLAASDVSHTFVLIETEAGAPVKRQIAGFFTLEAGVMPTAFLSLLPEDALSLLIPPAGAEEVPPRPGASPLSDLPVVYLARDLRYRGHGVGDLLLVEALSKTAQAANLLGAPVPGHHGGRGAVLRRIWLPLLRRLAAQDVPSDGRGAPCIGPGRRRARDVSECGRSVHAARLLSPFTQSVHALRAGPGQSPPGARSQSAAPCGVPRCR